MLIRMGKTSQDPARISQFDRQMNQRVIESGEFWESIGLRPQAPPVSTIGEIIRRRAEAQKDQPAIVSSDFAAMSYGELLSLIDQVRADLRSGGFGRHARIAVAMPNVPRPRSL